MGRMQWPVTGQITSLIGPRNGRQHDGIDIGAPTGREVYAAYGGTVTLRQNARGYGNYLDIAHPSGWRTRYAHLSRYEVSNGASVAQGQLIARVGSTGRSSGPHLHFEAHQGKRRFDNLNAATARGATVQDRHEIGIDFPGLGPSPSGPPPVYDPYFRGMAAAPPAGTGYWLVARDGGVFSFAAEFYGSMGGQPLAQPVVGIAAHPSGNGYYLVAADGGIFTFTRAGSNDVQFHGSMGGRPLNAPIVGMAVHPTGNGYYLVAADGGVFAFPEGGLPFHGSMGGKPLAQPMVGMAVHPGGNGYYLVAADGGVFAFPESGLPFHGSMGGEPLNEPMVGMAVTPSGDGYWLIAGDGGIFAFGDAKFIASGVQYDND